MIASIHPPLRIGLFVTSKVQKSRNLFWRPYCSAARRIPGLIPLPFSDNIVSQSEAIIDQLTFASDLSAINV